MDSLAVARIKRFLKDWLRCSPYDCGAVVFKMQGLARISGHALDERFARAGLGAGPEARVAAAIVDHALGGGSGDVTSKYEMRKMVDAWIRRAPPVGL